MSREAALGIRLFPYSDEVINLVVPIVFLLITVASLVVFPGDGFNNSQIAWVSFAAAFIGLNTIHNAFTLTIFYLPEVRQWAGEQSLAKGRNIFYLWGVVALFFLVLFQGEFYAMDWGNSRGFDSWWMRGLRFFQFSFTGVHAYSHYYGLSILYNQTSRSRGFFSAEEQTKFSRVERVERWLYRLFIFSGAFAVAAKVVLIDLPGEMYFVVFLLVQALALSGLSFFYPGASQSNKIIYQLRTFLVPLALLSPIALYGFIFTHGVEYWFIYKRMVANSKVENRQRIAWITLGASVLVGILALPRPDGGLPIFYELVTNLPVYWIKIIVGVSTAITYMHCYVDGCLFHFSDPVTRKNISPLLKPPA